MYANSSPFGSSPFGGNKALSGIYRQVGVETSVSSASPHELVRLLFDGYFESLAQAKGAIKSGDVAQKVRFLSKAIAIVDEGLKANLDMQHGGELASNLWNLYEYVSIRLTQANLKNDVAMIDECAQLLSPIRDGWNQISTPSKQVSVPQEVAA